MPLKIFREADDDKSFPVLTTADEDDVEEDDLDEDVDEDEEEEDDE